MVMTEFTGFIAPVVMRQRAYFQIREADGCRTHVAQHRVGDNSSVQRFGVKFNGSHNSHPENRVGRKEMFCERSGDYI